VVRDHGEVVGAQRGRGVEQIPFAARVLRFPTADHRREHVEVRARHRARRDGGAGGRVTPTQPRL
jgi:hypothetical protein